MRRRLLVVLAAWMAVSLVGVADLKAADSFFQRMSPDRYTRSASPTLPAATHGQLQPAAEGLNRRGIHAPIDPQLQHSRWRRVDGVSLDEQIVPRWKPTLEELRAHLLARGIDPDRLDARFARVPEANETSATNSQAGPRVQGSAGLTRGAVPSRLVRQEVSPVALNARLGRMYGIDGADHTVGDRSVGAGVGRLRSRR